MSGRDLDQSGFGFQRVRTYLGPSLGWVDELVQPTVEIKTGGVYVVQPGESLLLVEVAAAVTIQLPDVVKWMQQTAGMPATGFDRSITVKDIGGNAANFNIVTTPFGQQTIDNVQQSNVMSTSRAIVRFVPLIDMTGWAVQSNQGGGGTGGGGDVFKAGNNTYTGINTFNNSITVPNLPSDSNSNDAASTSFVKIQGYITGASLAPYALIASPTFTGNPQAPTPGPGDNDTSIATTAFVTAAIAAVPTAPPINAEYITSSANAALTNERVLTNTASITWDFSTAGQAKATTAVGGGNVSNSGTPTVNQIAQWVNATTIKGIDVSSLGFAPIANPVFTGDPQAPTPATADNDTSIATTAYVKANLGGLQPLDADLTALSALSGTNTIYYRSAPDIWSPVTYSGLSFSGGILTVTAGGGNVSNSGSPTAGQYSKWINATTIQGVAPATVLTDIGAQPAGSYQPLDTDLTAIAGLVSAADQAPYFTGSGTAALMTVTPAARTVLDDTTVGAMLTTLGGLSTAAAAAAYQPLDGDLTAIAALAGTNVIYYRSAANTWAAVTMGANMTFAGGVLDSLSGGGGGNVSNSGVPTVGQYGKWVTATTIQGVAPATVLSDIGAQPLDGDLTSLSSASSSNAIYYRIAANSWGPISIGTGLTFTSGTLATAQDYAPIASPVFTGDPQAPTPSLGDNDTSIATTNFVANNAQSTYGIRGLNGTSNPTTVAFSFTECVVRNSLGSGIRLGLRSISIDTTAAVGINGPDVALPASGDIHFYVIYNGASVAGIASVAAPTAGPALPSGYTYWAYVTTIKRASSSLLNTVIRGDWVTYQAAQNVLSVGNSGGAWVAASMSTAVPAIALNVQLAILAYVVASSAFGQLTHVIGTSWGNIIQNYVAQAWQASIAGYVTGTTILPNVSQTFWYTYASATGTLSGSGFSVNVISYQVPNNS